MAISQQILDSLINGSLIKVFFKDYRGDLPSLVDLTSLRNPLWHPGLGWKVPRFPSPECHEMNTMLGLWSINSSYFLLKCSYFNAWFNEWYRLFWEQFVVEGLEESKESIKLHSWERFKSKREGHERGWDGNTDPMNMSLIKLWEIVIDREACNAAVNGVAKSKIQVSDWTAIKSSFSNYKLFYLKNYFFFLRKYKSKYIL